MKNSTRSIIPALLAVSGGLASTPAHALEIGEVNVESKLGQPLRASISYALAPNEYLADYCISLSPRFASSGLPTIDWARIGVSNGVITLTGNTAIREPLMAMRLNVNCPYTPKITREYMLFVDPALPAVTRTTPARNSVVAATSAVATSGTAPQSSTSPTSAPRTNRAPINRAPIDASERYRVQVGDSLSGIAQRIENRSIGLWSAVEQIFAANPEAFINNDPNQLKAGSWLLMPDFGSQTGFAAETTVTQTLAPAEIAALAESATALETGSIYDAAFTTAGVSIDTAPPAVEVPDVPAVAEAPDTAQAPNEADDTAVLQPAEIILATDLDVPSTATNPNVPSASIIAADDTSASSINWLLWLNVAGIALLAGLFFFGRFGRFGRSPGASTAARPLRRSTDNNIENVEPSPSPLPLPIPEESILAEDDSPTEENLALDPDLMPGPDVELDADLEIGTGLQHATSVDVAQDFGFAVTTHLDLELPELAAKPAKDGKTSHTDIIKAPKIGGDSILDSEVLPADDEYDMSVIMDATKMQMPEEVTERDLKAVVVDTSNETMISDKYTLNHDMDYDILEQDYQDEMTATQALSIEIEKAAAEIAEQAGKEEADADDGGTDGKTASLPLATVTELDVATNPSTRKDSDDNTGADLEVTEKMIADENTVEMPGKSDTKAG